jgi:flavodoxin
MNALVIYGSRYGNTQHIAEAIADGLKDAMAVDVIDVEKATPALVKAADLVVVGGPTEAHGITPPLKAWIDSAAIALEGKKAAAFDTRLDFARIITGSAAKGIGAHLRTAGATLITDDESFLVKGKQPQLEPGELSRAVAWGREVAAKAGVQTPVAAR